MPLQCSINKKEQEEDILSIDPAVVFFVVNMSRMSILTNLHLACH
jgi:hypothetical protein